MSELLKIEEIARLDSRRNILRIPPEVDVPLTDRVRRLIDTREFQRLQRIRQLGLVSRVYPGAVHTRLEHSLGVFRLAVLLLKRLAYDSVFTEKVPVWGGELFLLTALLHDLGHYPYCHPIEDLRLSGSIRHEAQIAWYLQDETSALVRGIREEWGQEPADVLYLLSGQKPPHSTPLSENPTLYKLLASLLSGPVDIDKMDYLQRDSLHAGVPYGRNFDQERLLGSLCLNAAGDGLAISSKGKTAAELMVFARYVMFSEVYWHHAVRSATAMLQRLYFTLWQKNGSEFSEKLLTSTDEEAETLFYERVRGDSAERLWQGLFGSQRILYKQVAEFTFYEYPTIYHAIARKPYGWVVRFAEELASRLSQRLGRTVVSTDLLVDAPPFEREVEFIVDIYDAKEQKYHPFAEVSPVVKALAVQQFDDFVKRVRIFLHPDLKKEVSRELLEELVREEVRKTDFQ